MARSSIFSISFLLVIFASLPVMGAPLPGLPRMIRVDGGTYLQGSAETQYAANERVHATTVSPFYIAETETTQKLWGAIMGKNPSKFRGEERPVEYVSWLDAVLFCNELSAREGLEGAYTIEEGVVTWNRAANGYRLPTEAEWEFAARGGSRAASAETPLARAPYAGGTEADIVAWYDRNSAKSTQPVGRKEPNELNLYDMSGNVWEWCWDWYGEYPKAEVADFEGAPKGAGQKVLRGGAWFTPAHLLRVTYRYWNAPTFRVNSVGFRLARNAESPPANLASTNGSAANEPSSVEERFSRGLPSGVGLDLFEILSAPESELRH